MLENPKAEQTARKSPAVRINPNVWVWLREADGASSEDVAKKLKTDGSDIWSIRGTVWEQLRKHSLY